MTRTNIAINGVEHIKFCEGSLLEVRGPLIIAIEASLPRPGDMIYFYVEFGYSKTGLGALDLPNLRYRDPLKIAETRMIS